MSSVGSDDGNSILITLIPFFAIHLLPVWLYLGGCLLSGIKAKHTNYMITDKNIYIQSEVFSVITTVKPITDISHVTVNQGLFDRMCGTGDVICECNHMDFAGNGHSISHGTHISNIEDYETVFSMLRDVQTKINEK